MTTATARTVDLLNACDAYAREALGEPSAWLPNDPAAGELLALRHLVEALDRVGDGCPGGHRDLCGTPGFDHYWAAVARSEHDPAMFVCQLCGAVR